MKVDFEWGATYNIQVTGDIFAGTDANGQYHLVFNSIWNVYSGVTNFLHLTNALDSEVSISFITSGSGSIISGTKAVYLDGNPAYYNTLSVANCATMDVCIHLPFVTVGANANTIRNLNCQTVNYCIKIDASVSDNLIERLVVDAGGVVSAGTNAGIYINGFSNVVFYLYGEYNAGGNGGPLLYLDTSAQKNIIGQLLQEGSGGTYTDVATTQNNLVKRYPVPAAGSVTAGASVWTYTNNDDMQEQMVILTLNGLTGENCNSIGVNSSLLLTGYACILSPGNTMTATWATTAPVYQKVYLAS